MAAKKVVVIGGGVAGVGFAKALKEKAGDLVDITIVTKDPFYMAGPSRPLILTGEQKVDRIIRGYEEVARTARIVYGLATRIDPAERKVYVAESPTRPGGGVLEYDYLLVAPGVVLDDTAIEGLAERRHLNATPYEPGRVQTLRNRLWSVKEGAVLVYAPPMPYRCAPAPSETTLLAHTILANRGVRDKVEVIHVDANDKPQPPVIADILKNLFEEAGVTLITGKKIVEVADDHVVLDDGEKVKFTVLSLIEPNRAPKFIEEAGLGKAWFEVRSPQDLRNTKYDDILAAGDVAKLPFPKNQEIAYESALVAANNILDDLGIPDKHTVQYAFLGWAYVGNIRGELESLSVRFGLNFATKPPKPSKDPEPKKEYTKAKDDWEQAYLRNLYGY